jgi:hypothetical protein
VVPHHVVIRAVVPAECLDIPGEFDLLQCLVGGILRDTRLRVLLLLGLNPTEVGRPVPLGERATTTSCLVFAEAEGLPPGAQEELLYQVEVVGILLQGLIVEYQVLELVIMLLLLIIVVVVVMVMSA